MGSWSHGPLGPGAHGLMGRTARVGLAKPEICTAQAGETLCHLKVLRPKMVLQDGQSPLQEVLRGLGVAKLTFCIGQDAGTLCHLNVLRPKMVLLDAQSLLYEALRGLGVAK